MNAKTIVKFVIAPALLLLTVALIVIGCQSTSSSTPASPREQFDSPEAAVQTLVKALRNRDVAHLKKILAPGGDDILSSGDPVSDRADAERFLALFDEGHRFEADSAGVNTLLVGQADWPFPVPIVKAGKKYEFDVETGEDEILNRRIG